MCLKFFKRRKDKVEELPKESLQWNKMWKLWTDGKIESPYFELMDYLSGVNNGGHHCHFDNTNNNCNLKEYVKQLKTILPEPLKTNVDVAYRAYMENPDDVSEKNSEVLASCDEIYYQNEEIVNNLLKARAEKIEL